MASPPNRFDYSPIIDRPVIKWPNNARVAYLPPLDGVRNPWPAPPIPTCSNTPPMNMATAWA